MVHLVNRFLDIAPREDSGRSVWAIHWCQSEQCYMNPHYIDISFTDIIEKNHLIRYLTKPSSTWHSGTRSNNLPSENSPQSPGNYAVDILDSKPQVHVQAQQKQLSDAAAAAAAAAAKVGNAWEGWQPFWRYRYFGCVSRRLLFHRGRCSPLSWLRMKVDTAHVCSEIGAGIYTTGMYFSLQHWDNPGDLGAGICSPSRVGFSGLS